MSNIVNIYNKDKYREGSRLLIQIYDKSIAKGLIGTVISKETIERKYKGTIENILKQYKYHLIFNMPIIDLAYRKEDVIYLKIEEGEQYIKDKQNPYYDMLIGKIFILKKESKDEYVMYKKL